MKDSDSNTGNLNTGDWNTGNLNTGDWNTGNLNTGSANTGYRNTGNWNTGNWNTGDQNTGNWNTGNLNTGSANTGYRNTGDQNTGNWNTGDQNTGNWNTGNRNNGFFNTETPVTVNVFDVPTSMTDWEECDKPGFIYFSLTEWISESCMSEKEKEENKGYKAVKGYLKKLDYKEAFKESYEKATQEDKDKIFNLPNFDAEKFLEISGIDVRIDTEQERKKQELIAKAKELLAQAEKM